MTPITCGLYMQPPWSSVTGVVGTCQLRSGRPDFTHTNAYFTVLFGLMTTSSEGVEPGCARMQTGFADMSMFSAVGLEPSKEALPVAVPPFASSGVAAPPAGADALSVALGVSAVFSPPPHPERLSAATSPAPIQNFVIFSQYLLSSICVLRVISAISASLR